MLLTVLENWKSQTEWLNVQSILKTDEKATLMALMNQWNILF